MFKILRFKRSYLIFLMGWLPLLGACTQPADPIVNTAAANADPSMNIAKSVAPIDATGPTSFETASFGLG